MSEPRGFVRSHPGLLGFGVLLTFFSCFGQTFLISLYTPSLAGATGLGNTGLSSLYAAATVASALTLPWLGREIDRRDLRVFTATMIVGFTLALAGLSFAATPLAVGVGLFGLRLFGQSLMGHTAVTTMARAFLAHRGKAIGAATLGYPLSEATVPLLVAAAIATVGWRWSLRASAAVLLVLVLPLALRLLRRQAAAVLEPHLHVPPDAAVEEASTEDGQARSAAPGAARRGSWAFLRQRSFAWIVPTVFVLGFLNTAIFFFQVRLGAARDWSPAWVAGSLSAYAAASALSMLGAGPVVDRLGARRLFPFVLLPYILAMLLLSRGHAPWVYPAGLVLMASSNGMGSTITNALYAEIFGTAQLGAVRSVFTTLMVVSTALGPVSFGLLLDAGVGFDAIFGGATLLVAAVAVVSMLGARW